MFVQTDNDTFFCCAYIPPENTTQSILSKIDYFRDLEKAILKSQ